MRGIVGLTKDFITRLEGDELLSEVVGATVKVYTERPEDQSIWPLFVLDMLSADQNNNQSDRGTEYLFQVSLFLPRMEGGSTRGISDIAQACERIRDILDDADGYALPASPSPGASLSLDPTIGRYEQSGTEAWLTLRQYISANILTDLAGGYISGICRFRCLVSNTGE